MNHQDLLELIKNIQQMMRCPRCGKNYNFEEIEVKGQVDDAAILMQLICNSCGTPVLATIIGPMPNAEKQNQQRAKSPISSDDLIQFHQELQKFKGDFKSLFNK